MDLNKASEGLNINNNSVILALLALRTLLIGLTLYPATQFYPEKNN